MKIFTGKVISKKMQKTATVVVARVVVHPIYKKRIRKIKKYQVHDEFGTEVGNIVKFAASKPFSKTKKWKIIETVENDKGRNKTKEKVQRGAFNKKKGNTKNVEKKIKIAVPNKRKGGKK